MREQFWGDKDQTAPSSKERALRLRTFMVKFFDTSTKKYRYTVGNEDKKRQICEQGWLRIMGEKLQTCCFTNDVMILTFS